MMKGNGPTILCKFDMKKGTKANNTQQQIKKHHLGPASLGPLWCIRGGKRFCNKNNNNKQTQKLTNTTLWCLLSKRTQPATFNTSGFPNGYSDDDDEVELHVLGSRLTYWGPMPKHGSMLLYVHRNRKAH